MADHPSESTPQLVAVIDGPWGSELRYFESMTDNGTVCLNHVQVPRGEDATVLTDAEDWTAGGLCGDRGPDMVALTSVAGGPWYYDVTGTAGDAVSADIEVSDGTVYPVTVAGGWLMGWFGAAPDQTAVLTGYDQDGQPMARIVLTDSR
jgi:hypothetical protein